MLTVMLKKNETQLTPDNLERALATARDTSRETEPPCRMDSYKKDKATLIDLEIEN